jgi:uncharacterized protein (TIGR02569 family)
VRPPEPVLEAFGVRGRPRLLDGGQGRTWRAGEVVLKPVDHEVEHVWVCQVYDGWSSPEVSVPRPLRTAAGEWSAAGWAAHRWAPGTTAHAGDDPDWFRSAVGAFHAALAAVPVPDFVRTRDDPWSAGDRVAWEGQRPDGADETVRLVHEALALYEPVSLGVQLVHGDLSGNLLRDGDRPTVIDWPPYVRPVGWALAVAALDAVCWDGAAPALLDRWSDEAEWGQLLLRALVYRLATLGRRETLGLARPDDGSFRAVERGALQLVRERL